MSFTFFKQKLSIIKFLVVPLTLVFLLFACRKSLDQSFVSKDLYNPSNERLNTGLISKWYDWYNKSISNAPKLDFSKAQTSRIKNIEVIRIPVQNSRGMIYFYESNGLKAFFIRDNRGFGLNRGIKPNIEFINLNTFEYKVSTYQNGKVDSVFTALLERPSSSTKQSNLETIVKKSNGTFWFDVGCVLSLGIPRWGPTGERECWGLNIWGWLGEAFSEDQSGERDLEGGYWTSFQSGYFGGVGLEPGNNGPSDPGSFASFLPTISVDPTILAPENWDYISDDFYSEDGDEDDVNNSADTGPLGYFPSYFSFSNNRVVTIIFGTTSSDNLSANQEVSQRLIDAVRDALDAATLTENITSIYIKATTNGGHQNGSNHYKKLAVDISRINGVPIITTGANSKVTALQNALDNVTHRRENFGPAFKHKFGSPWTVGGHADHIHFSVNGY